MLYTHAWGIFFGVGAALALIPVWLASEDRRGLLRDARVRVRRAPAVLFLPWLPTLLYQATHTGSPWDTAPQLRRAGADLAQPDGRRPGHHRARARRRHRPRARCSRARAGARARRTTMWALILLPVGTLAFGWIVSQLLARLAVPLLRADPRRAAAVRGAGAWPALGHRRADRARRWCVVFWANPASYTPAVQERHARHRRAR